MRFEGKLIKWYDDKGFGFIRATQDSKDVFLHISEIQKLKQRPKINALLSYEIARDDKGRFRAVNVGYSLAHKSVKKVDSPVSFSVAFIVYFLLFTAFIIERTLKGFLPEVFPFIFIGANLVVFLYYYQDKTSALKSDWRTPEATLHWLSLIGGWGGAYIAQKLFRHKYKKDAFMMTYKLTVFVNCLVITIYSVPQLRSFLMDSI